ncbi:MAG: hypothetical protein SFY81_15030 [Verrucomicrobiota bacterium]|nr:hypothetical protein [Verrucomicrobiota bacterium]
MTVSIGTITNPKSTNICMISNLAVSVIICAMNVSGNGKVFPKANKTVLIIDKSLINQTSSSRGIGERKDAGILVMTGRKAPGMAMNQVILNALKSIVATVVIPVKNPAGEEKSDLPTVRKIIITEALKMIERVSDVILLKNVKDTRCKETMGMIKPLVAENGTNLVLKITIISIVQRVSMI